jgi:hypothetical protein
MQSRIFSLLVLVSVSLGATIQMPLGYKHPERATIEQVDPSIFTGNERRETCITLRTNLTQEGIDVCDYFSKEDFIPGHLWISRVDFVAHICGLMTELLSIHFNQLSDWAYIVPRLGPGVLYDRFALDTFKAFGVIGTWQEIQATIFCLKEQKDTTRNTE